MHGRVKLGDPRIADSSSRNADFRKSLIEVMADERWKRLAEQQGVAYAKTVAEAMSLKLDMDSPADREKLRRAVLDLVRREKNAKAKRASLKFSRSATLRFHAVPEGYVLPELKPTHTPRRWTISITKSHPCWLPRRVFTPRTLQPRTGLGWFET